MNKIFMYLLTILNIALIIVVLHLHQTIVNATQVLEDVVLLQAETESLVLQAAQKELEAAKLSLDTEQKKNKYYKELIDFVLDQE